MFHSITIFTVFFDLMNSALVRFFQKNLIDHKLLMEVYVVYLSNQ